MVFLTLVNMMSRVRNPDKFWRVNQYLRMSWHFRGRKRTCYRIGTRVLHKALMYSYQSAELRKKQMKHLWNTRLDAGAYEHDISRIDLVEGLARSNIQLDKKVLSELAIYEPRTFQSLTEISKQKLQEDGKTTYSAPSWQKS